MPVMKFDLRSFLKIIYQKKHEENVVCRSAQDAFYRQPIQRFETVAIFGAKFGLWHYFKKMALILMNPESCAK
jgi:hypothetical protein